MTEYIEREKAMFQIDVADFVRDNDFQGGATLLFYDDVVDRLSAIPAADVRPVVLCKDCQDSYKWENAHGDSYRYCGYLRSRWNHDTDRMVDDDDYCKWGVKREGS